MADVQLAFERFADGQKEYHIDKMDYIGMIISPLQKYLLADSKHFFIKKDNYEDGVLINSIVLYNNGIWFFPDIKLERKNEVKSILIQDIFTIKTNMLSIFPRNVNSQIKVTTTVIEKQKDLNTDYCLIVRKTPIVNIFTNFIIIAIFQYVEKITQDDSEKAESLQKYLFDEAKRLNILLKNFEIPRKQDIVRLIQESNQFITLYINDYNKLNHQSNININNYLLKVPDTQTATEPDKLSDITSDDPSKGGGKRPTYVCFIDSNGKNIRKKIYHINEKEKLLDGKNIFIAIQTYKRKYKLKLRK